MLLRDHPLINYRGVRTWPPRWHARGDGLAPPVVGEAGVLTEVAMSHPSAHNVSPPQLFLFMENHGHRYLAAVLVSDETFCRQLCMLLKNHYGRTLAEIGSLDLGGLL